MLSETLHTFFFLPSLFPSVLPSFRTAFLHSFCPSFLPSFLPVSVPSQKTAFINLIEKLITSILSFSHMVFHTLGYLSHNNSCYQCYIAITNFLVPHICEIKFHFVTGQSTIQMYSSAKILKHG